MRRWLLLCLVACTGCRYDSYLESLYTETRSHLDHGELPAAQQACRRGSVLATGSEVWDWKFRSIEAEIRIQRREPERALAILSGKLPASLVNSETDLLVNLERGAASSWIGKERKNARGYLDAAEQLAQRPENARWLGAIRLRRGTFFLLQGLYEEAGNDYLDAIHLAQSTGQPLLEVSALTSYGSLLMRRNRYGPAVDWLKPAIDLSRRRSTKTLLQRNLGNIGWSYYNLGEIDPALANLKEAEQLAGSINLLDDQRRWLTNIGLIYSTLQRYDQAENHHVRALAMARRIGDKDAIADCLHNLAMNAVDRRNLEAAREYNREEMELERTLYDVPGQLYARYTEGTIEDGLKNYSAAEKAFREVTKASDPSLRWQALCWLAGTHIEQGKGQEARQDYDAAVKTFDDARKQQGSDEFKIAFRAGVNRYYSPYIRFLMNQGSTFDALKVAELSRAQVLSERLGVDPGAQLSLPKIQATAAALHATLLSYWLAPKASYLWVVTPTDFVAITLPDSAILPLVDAYRRSVAASSHTTDTRLYETLIAPAQKYIPPGGRVVLIPDAALFQVNFETLQVPGGHYWIEDVILSTATSLSLLSARHESSGRGNVLLIGNSLSPSPEFPALRYSGAELHSIADRFPEKQRAVFEGGEAVPSAYAKALPEAYSWIHFAAHGVASTESPLESAIILSNEADSFKLYARDIAKHRLTADLVTISACYGSGTRTYAGEGIVGLARAFLLAGAHNVVASLWEANDYYTAQLMDRMYERLKAGDDPAHALRTAKLTLLRSQYICRNPRYWGAFQLYTGY